MNIFGQMFKVIITISFSSCTSLDIRDGEKLRKCKNKEIMLNTHEV